NLLSCYYPLPTAGGQTSGPPTRIPNYRLEQARMTTPFPPSPTFSTIDEPFRFEGDLYDLEVMEGRIPQELDGTFYSIGPDQAFPPKMGDANPFNGDGFVRAFRFKDGHCDLK